MRDPPEPRASACAVLPGPATPPQNSALHNISNSIYQKALGKKLKAAQLDLSPSLALQALRTVQVVDINLGNGKTKRSVSRGSDPCASVLRALDITQLEPPKPPKGQPEIE